MDIKEDLKKKIEALSKKMDDALNSGNCSIYSRLADTYLKLVRVYESISKTNKYAYWTNPTPYLEPDYGTVKNPLKWSEITCNTGTPTYTVNKLNLASSDTTDLLQKIQDVVKANVNNTLNKNYIL
jgi:hypothetical protein